MRLLIMAEYLQQLGVFFFSFKEKRKNTLRLRDICTEHDDGSQCGNR